MRERPILFNGAMVRAILAGDKTQTRRAVKGVAGDNCLILRKPTKTRSGVVTHVMDAPGRGLCPFGEVGDLLWVRESFGHRWHPCQPPFFHRASDDGEVGRNPDFDGWRPSIHMPREACRLVLEITDVRVERLQAISAADAIAEGLSQTDSGAWLPGPCDHPEWAFHQLWAQVYGESAWDSNPWVWVIEFKAAEQPRAALATD